MYNNLKAEEGLSRGGAYCLSEWGMLQGLLHA